MSAARVALCILATWVVPGAGHWMLGRRGKALLYFSLITFLFVFGMVIGEFRVLNLEHFWLHFLGQVFYAGLALPGMWWTGNLGLAPAIDPGGVTLAFPFLDVGVLYTTVAGLLNICVMVDVYETAFPRRSKATENAE